MHLEQISIIGAGLLGGSLGLAIRQRQVSAKVHAYVRRPESVAECQRLGVAQFATQNMREAVERADLVILCTPLSQMRELTLKTIEDVRQLLAGTAIPAAVLKPQCDGCSLRRTCLPELTCSVHSLDAAFAELFTP